MARLDSERTMGNTPIKKAEPENKQSIITLILETDISESLPERYLFRLFRPVFIFGQIVFAIPSNLLKNTSTGENIYLVKCSKWKIVLFLLLQILAVGFLIKQLLSLPLIDIPLDMSKFKNVTIVREVAILYHLALISYVIIIYVTFLTKNLTFASIFDQADNVERLLIENGISYKFPWVKLPSFLICLVFLTSGVLKYISESQSSFDELLNAKTTELIDLLTFSNERLDISKLKPGIKYAIGSCALALDFLTTCALNFGDAVRIIFALTMWRIYFKVNQAIANGVFGIKNAQKALEIQFATSLLMKKINQLLAPFTFFGTILLILSSLNFINYLITSYSATGSSIYLQLHLFRNIGITAFCVFVSIEAQNLSDWLKEIISLNLNPDDLSEISQQQLILLYMNRTCKGFKGFSFYITPACVLLILSIIFLYSLLISRFVKEECG